MNCKHKWGPDYSGPMWRKCTLCNNLKVYRDGYVIYYGPEYGDGGYRNVTYKREMTLVEYTEQLPKKHKVRKFVELLYILE